MMSLGVAVKMARGALISRVSWAMLSSTDPCVLIKPCDVTSYLPQPRLPSLPFGTEAIGRRFWHFKSFRLCERWCAYGRFLSGFP
jgi:hypothetical protein